MENIVENAPLGVRFFSGGSAVVYIIGGLTNIYFHSFYTSAIVSLYAIFFGIIALLCEFSPYGLYILLTLCPPLGEYKPRGIFYMCVGLLTMGDDMKFIGKLGGYLMIISGCCSIAMHYLGPAQMPIGCADGVVANDTGFDNFERYTDGYGQI